MEAKIAKPRKARESKPAKPKPVRIYRPTAVPGGVVLTLEEFVIMRRDGREPVFEELFFED